VSKVGQGFYRPSPLQPSQEDFTRLEQELEDLVMGNTEPEQPFSAKGELLGLFDRLSPAMQELFLRHGIQWLYEHEHALSYVISPQWQTAPFSKPKTSFSQTQLQRKREQDI